MALLEVRGLGYQRGSRWVLRDLDFAVGPGEALGLVGESGAGKTTLAHLVLGLLTPDRGEIRLEGRPWSGLPESRRRALRPRLQAVFQDPKASLPPHLTGWEILAEPLRIHGRGDARSRRQAAAAMAARVKFPEGALGQRCAQWSGGLAQRLCLARALMLKPDLLVLDEPLSALDPTLAGHLMGLLESLKAEGTALLLVSHDLPAVARLCERLLVLCGGEALAAGPTERLLEELAHPYLRGLWEAVPDLDHPGAPRRWGQDGETPAGACVLYGRCPRADAACRTAPPPGNLRCHHPWPRTGGE